MRIGFTHNCRRSDSEEEAEFDSPEIIASIAAALEGGGHEVSLIEVTDESPIAVAARLRQEAPQLVLNTIEGKRGRSREALYPLLFETLGIPFVGSDAHAMTVTLDKWLTKLSVAAHGLRTPQARLFHSGALDFRAPLQAQASELRLTLFVNPNYEGSAKGIDSASIVTTWDELATVARRLLARYPEGILVEEFIRGHDVTVPIVQGLGVPAQEGVLMPCGYEFAGIAGSAHEIYDYKLKNQDSHRVVVLCPAPLPSAILEQVRAATATAVRALGVRDFGRADFRVSEDGEILFLEMNALPSLEPGASLFQATGELGLSYSGPLLHMLEHAAARHQVPHLHERGATDRPCVSVGVGSSDQLMIN